MSLRSVIWLEAYRLNAKTLQTDIKWRMHTTKGQVLHWDVWVSRRAARVNFLHADFLVFAKNL